MFCNLHLISGAGTKPNKNNDSKKIVLVIDQSAKKLRFPTPYTEGIINAYWWAVVTISNVGYGDKRRKKISRRAIAAILMFIGIIWLVGILTRTFVPI